MKNKDKVIYGNVKITQGFLNSLNKLYNLNKLANKYEKSENSFLETDFIDKEYLEILKDILKVQSNIIKKFRKAIFIAATEGHAYTMRPDALDSYEKGYEHWGEDAQEKLKQRDLNAISYIKNIIEGYDIPDYLLPEGFEKFKRDQK